jgi:hypothetical protein
VGERGTGIGQGACCLGVGERGFGVGQGGLGEHGVEPLGE